MFEKLSAFGYRLCRMTHALQADVLAARTWPSVRRAGSTCASGDDRTCAAFGRFIISLFVLVLTTCGCSVHPSVFEIVDYREPGEARRYVETFTEAYYDIDEHGNVDIVLRRSSPDDSRSRQTLAQVIHIRSFWRPIPGATVAHRTQINGTVVYHIVAGRFGATFEGAGSVFFKETRRGDTLSGSLDLALLRPKRQLAFGGGLFKRAELRGAFQAKRDPRRVVRIINELNRLFGPMAPHDAHVSTPP